VSQNERGGGEARRRSIRALVRSLPPESRLIGAEVQTLVGKAAEGEVASTRTSGFALSLGAFPEASVHSFYAHTNGVSAASLRAKLAEQRAYDSWSVIVLIVIGRGRFDLILDELQSASPNAAIIGGVATGRWLLHAHAHTATFISSGVVGLCFGGNVPLKALVCNRQVTAYPAALRPPPSPLAPRPRPRLRPSPLALALARVCKGTRPSPSPFTRTRWLTTARLHVRLAARALGCLSARLLRRHRD
jgi:hypothetical protein